MIPAGFEDLTVLILITLWTLPWKGVALWRAANRGEKKWFIAMLVLNTLAILEIVYIFIFSKRPQKQADKPARKGAKRNALSAARKTIQSKKEEAKQKVLDSVAQRGQISNADVEILLGVSDATATRYLEELEREEKIQQKGNVGRGVFYVPK